MAVKPIPDGYHTITPYLIVSDVEAQIDWMKRALGAREKHVSPGPDGKAMHAELRVGDSNVMLGRAAEQWPAQQGMYYLYVEDCDAWHKRAVAEGAKSVMDPADQFYGDRNAGVVDPAGISWWFATHKEDLDEAELARRAAESYRNRS